MLIDFVDRLREISLIEDSLEDVYRGRDLRHPVLEFYGIRGIGKSALLEQLSTRCNLKYIPSALTNFANTRRWGARPEVAVLEDLAGQLRTRGCLLERFWSETEELEGGLEQWQQEEGAEGARYHLQRAKLTTTFVRSIEALGETTCIALLFDTIERANPETIEWIEVDLLEKLLHLRNCLIVLAGRKPVKWKSFDVRQRVRSYELKAFSEFDTIEYINRVSASRYNDIADLIAQVTQGYPAGNVWIVQELRRQWGEDEAIARTAFEDAMPELMRGLVETLLLRYVLHDADRRYQDIFFYLAGVRQFDASILQVVIEGFLPQYRCETGLGYVGLIQEMVEHTGLVHYDPARKGYVLEATVRSILSAYNRMVQPQTYIALNRALAEKYDEWLHRTDVPSLDMVKSSLEKLYHLGKLLELTEGVEAALSEMLAVLQKDLESLYSGEGEQVAFARLQLCEELEQEQLVRDGIPFAGRLARVARRSP